jgi:hypothetical protein
MNKMQHYDFEISQFIDNELSASEQKELFLHLSGCEECSKILSDFMGMKNGAKSHYNNLSAELKSPAGLLIGSTAVKKRNVYKRLFYVSMAASIVFAILLLSKVSDVDRLKIKYTELEVKIVGINNADKSKSQKDITSTINFKNSSFDENKILPTRKDHIIRRYKNKFELLDVNKTERNPSSGVVKNNNSGPSQRPQEIQMVQVTKNDFLTPQIVGN